MNALYSAVVVVAVMSIFIIGCEGSSLVTSKRISQLLDKTADTWPAINHLAEQAGSNKIGSKELDYKLTKAKFPAAASNHRQQAVSVIEELNQRRQACGFGGLQKNENLMALSEHHAQYLQHVFVQAGSLPSQYSPHSEQSVPELAEVTGQQNPYYMGDDLAARLQTANYPYREHRVGESLSIRLLYESKGIGEVNTDNITSEMLGSLLAAPYHLATLMSPTFNQNGTSVISFVPHKQDNNKARGFVLVSTNGASSNLPLPDQLLTYPCEGSRDTARMLDNESPNPVQGLGRDLRTDPVGQPLYITYPAAKKIQVSHINFIEVASQQKIPTYLLDANTDPHNHTTAQLPANSAFIIPLTDSFNNCTATKHSGHNNCGLNANTRYRVSFTVQVDDGSTLQRSIDFMTGS